MRYGSLQLLIFLLLANLMSHYSAIQNVKMLALLYFGAQRPLSNLRVVRNEKSSNRMSEEESSSLHLGTKLKKCLAILHYVSYSILNDIRSFR